ncbi:MAG: 30S ribosomal protein S12 methylthiotransferase RimO [Clostridiales bacterium]|nr:30S ribosomal protein S12 methylthiotransferase RimO [Clostridiales bacterium]
MAVRIGLVSLGCSKNLVDSEVMLGMLRERGCEIVSDPAQADIAIVNTCGFIDSAKQESIDAILEMAELKKQGHPRKLLVTGCLAQRYADELIKELPEVDGFMGVHDYSRLNEAVDELLNGGRPVCMERGERFLNQKRVLTTPKFSAYVKISDGCDNRCTYCAIPLIRGRYSSRPYEDIMEECRQLARSGVKELTFIAQDTSRYGSDFEGHPLLLKKLLHEASLIDGIRWVRVLYCYPDTVNEELLTEIRDNPKICAYLDLPLQHINDELLRKMNRRGDRAHIERLLAKCREYGIIIRTTFIVGFPGETQAQFEELLEFVKKWKFDRMGAFTYSPEEDTPAAIMPGQIDEAVKAERLDALMLTQQQISLENNQRRIGTKVTALIEGTEDGMLTARSYAESPEADGIIRVKQTGDCKPGDFVSVRITDCDAYDLTGVIE